MCEYEVRTSRTKNDLSSKLLLPRFAPAKSKLDRFWQKPDPVLILQEGAPLELRAGLTLSPAPGLLALSHNEHRSGICQLCVSSN